MQYLYVEYLMQLYVEYFLSVSNPLGFEHYIHM